jgi:hypothetical protein
MAYERDPLDSMIHPLAFGLSGANLIAVLQFLGNDKVPILAMCALIASMPVLIICGILASALDKVVHRKVSERESIITMMGFILGASTSVFGFFMLFSAYRIVFAVAFAVGCALVFLLLKLLHRAVTAAKKAG